jgi:hypothetical protein
MGEIEIGLQDAIVTAQSAIGRKIDNLVTAAQIILRSRTGADKGAMLALQKQNLFPGRG